MTIVEWVDKLKEWNDYNRRVSRYTRRQSCLIVDDQLNTLEW